MADLMQQASELLPCPFCGEAAKHTVWGDAGFNKVECTYCDVGMDYFYHQDDAFEAWNRRSALRAAPEGCILVPVEPTPERLAAAALAVLAPANGDMELARRAAQIVIQSADAPHGITVDMIAASISTMAPAYRAMTAARPQGVR